MSREDLETNFKFYSNEEYYWKEEADIKNNTIRVIDLTDERFLHLIAWNTFGYNDGDIKITIALHTPGGELGKQFTRNIRDISIYKEYMIITWMEKKKYV